MKTEVTQKDEVLSRLIQGIEMVHQDGNFDKGEGGAHTTQVAKKLGISESLAREQLMKYSKKTDEIIQVNGWSENTHVRKSYITRELYKKLDYGTDKPDPGPRAKIVEV